MRSGWRWIAVSTLLPRAVVPLRVLGAVQPSGVEMTAIYRANGFTTSSLARILYKVRAGQAIFSLSGPSQFHAEATAGDKPWLFYHGVTFRNTSAQNQRLVGSAIQSPPADAGEPGV